MESDEDDMELTQEELHKWIREEVKKSKLVDLSVGEMCQLLLEKIEKKKAGFDRLTQSVADLEVLIQQLYSLLGWEYREEDSEDGDELQCTHPAMGSNAMVEPSVSVGGEDADAVGRPLECDEKPKLKRTAVPLEATSTRLQPDSSSTQLRCARPGPYCGKQRNKLGSGEPTSVSASGRRLVVLLKRISVREIHSALHPKSPTLHAVGGADCDNGVVDTDKDNGADDVIDKHRGATTGCDPDSLSEDPWDGTATARTVKTKALSQISAKDKAEMRSKSVKVEGQNGDALTSAEPQGCGTVSPSVSHPYTLNPPRKPPTFSEQQIGPNMKVLARRRNRKWLPGKIVAIFPKEGGEGFKYKVMLEERGRILVSGHHLAFETPPAPQGLYVGACVVTQRQGQGDNQPSFHSGVLGELPSKMNSMRFLVFLDDHTPTYVRLPSLHLVCRPLAEPWAEISDDAHRRFIREYLRVWPYPPMAHYRVDQQLNVECEGVQRACQVLQIDCSLMHVLFKHSGNKEWIYRGSMRLERLVGVKKVLQKTGRGGEMSAAKPSVAAMVNYTPHLCSPACLEQVRPDRPPEVSRKSNPLLVPMTYKFRRVKKRPSQDPTPTRTPEPYSVYYYAPCGLPLTTIAQVEEYLYDTRCDFLSVDTFSLDPLVSVAAAKPFPFEAFVPDLAGGGEDKAVSFLNEHSSCLPAKLAYRKCRDTSRVRLDASPGFVAGCDCVDGCRDSESCSCRQLAIQSTGERAVDKNVGYAQKRLFSPVVTGVYECNAQCPCDPRTCSNRVVQQGLQARLQVFKTQDCGWGVRCLDDLPGGTFVCSYSGRVVPANEKNRTSSAHFAELNHIEEVELHKADYENEAYCSETDDCSFQSKELEQNGGPSVGVANNQTSEQTKAKDPTFKRKKPASPMVPMTTSRCFFDGENHGYIIDANMEGNVARFLNHSFSPNLFKQFVFVDTHDLRFPWLTFFTKKRVKAGTELTWDYRSVRTDDAEMLWL